MVAHAKRLTFPFDAYEPSGKPPIWITSLRHMTGALAKDANIWKDVLWNGGYSILVELPSYSVGTGSDSKQQLQQKNCSFTHARINITFVQHATLLSGAFTIKQKLICSIPAINHWQIRNTFKRITYIWAPPQGQRNWSIPILHSPVADVIRPNITPEHALSPNQFDTKWPAAAGSLLSLRYSAASLLRNPLQQRRADAFLKRQMQYERGDKISHIWSVDLCLLSKIK